MAVKVVEKNTGKTHAGKLAVLQGEQIALWSGVMSDKKGGFRGCGKRALFQAASVTVSADDPAKEIIKKA